MSIGRTITIGAVLAVLVMAAVLQWRACQPESRVPTLGRVCGYLLTYRVGRLPVGRIGLLGFWWWVGWHFLAR